MRVPTAHIEPTVEDVAAIVAVLFGEQTETIQESDWQSPWVAAARIEAIEKWKQPGRLSRVVESRWVND